MNDLMNLIVYNSINKWLFGQINSQQAPVPG